MSCQQQYTDVLLKYSNDKCTDSLHDLKCIILYCTSSGISCTSFCRQELLYHSNILNCVWQTTQEDRFLLIHLIWTESRGALTET